MNKKRSNRRSLVMSVLSMLMCVALLAGSTFAWFTDNASTAVNKIESGTLDIQLLDTESTTANSLEGKSLSFEKAAASESKEILFEPGARYALQQAWLYNNGSLHAKYQVVITGIDGSSELAKVLDVYVNNEFAGTLATLIAAKNGIIKENTIAPKTFDTFGRIELMMQTTAGNEYQGLSLNGVAITVQATQAAVEYDSTNNTYDAGATYTELVRAESQDALNEAIQNASKDKPVTVVLSEGTYNFTDAGTDLQNKDVTFSGTEKTVFDMSAQQGVNGVQDLIGTTLTFDGVTVIWSDHNEGYQGIKNPGKVVYKNCTITGTQFMYSSADFINCTFKVGSGYAVYTRASGNYTFTDCDFQTGGRAIMMYHDAPINANVTLTNCTFSDDGTYTSKDKAVVETGDYGSASVFNITINNCTVTKGFETNNSTSNLWGNKDSIGTDRLNVVIDGTDVY